MILLMITALLVLALLMQHSPWGVHFEDRSKMFLSGLQVYGGSDLLLCLPPYSIRKFRQSIDSMAKERMMKKIKCGVSEIGGRS